MDFNSWPPHSSSSASRRQKGHHTDPIMYPVDIKSSEWARRSRKRSAEESTETPSKRSRGSDSQPGTSTTVITPLKPINNKPAMCTPTPRHHTDSIMYPVDIKSSEWARRSRKRSAEESTETPSKRSRGSDSQPGTSTTVITPLKPINNKPAMCTPTPILYKFGVLRRVRSGLPEWRNNATKRSSDEPLPGPSKRSRQSHSPSESAETSAQPSSHTKIPSNKDKKTSAHTMIENRCKKRSRKRCDRLQNSPQDIEEAEKERRTVEQMEEKERLLREQRKLEIDQERIRKWEEEWQLIFKARQKRAKKQEKPNKPEERLDRAEEVKEKDGPKKKLDQKERPKRLQEREKPKNKPEDREEPRKKSQKTNRSREDSQPSQNEQPGTSASEFPRCLKQKSTFRNKYVQSDLIGEGGFGQVYLGHRKSDKKKVAIKYMPKDQTLFTEMEMDGNTVNVPTEVALMLKLKPQRGQISVCPKLLEWYEVGKDIILVMEYIESTMDLSAYLRSKGGILPEPEARVIMRQIVNAFCEIHDRGVFHRDIKLENILIAPGNPLPRIWIIDFGCGTYTSTTCREDIGTEPYKPPNMVRGFYYRAQPTTVWQLGTVAYELLHRRMPFSDRRAITREEPKITPTISLTGKDFIKTCLQKDEDKRPTLKVLKNHYWLRR